MLTALIMAITGCSSLTIGYALGYRAGVNDTRSGFDTFRHRGKR
jgi:hypothetical protein